MLEERVKRSEIRNHVSLHQINGQTLFDLHCACKKCFEILLTRHRNKIVIFSAIDNLVKGASGQAIQNMNLLYDYKENLGLK